MGGDGGSSERPEDRVEVMVVRKVLDEVNGGDHRSAGGLGSAPKNEIEGAGGRDDARGQRLRAIRRVELGFARCHPDGGPVRVTEEFEGERAVDRRDRAVPSGPKHVRPLSLAGITVRMDERDDLCDRGHRVGIWV